MFDPEYTAAPELKPTRIFVATIEVEVAATSKMDAASRIRMMSITSSVPMRSMEVTNIDMLE